MKWVMIATYVSHCMVNDESGLWNEFFELYVCEFELYVCELLLIIRMWITMVNDGSGLFGVILAIMVC